MARLRFNATAGKRLLNDPGVTADVARRTKQVADACNSQSSWGGYNSEVNIDGERPVGRVWSIGKSDRPGGDRALRLIQNLDKGR